MFLASAEIIVITGYLNINLFKIYANLEWFLKDTVMENIHNKASSGKSLLKIIYY